MQCQIIDTCIGPLLYIALDSNYECFDRKIFKIQINRFCYCDINYKSGRPAIISLIFMYLHIQLLPGLAHLFFLYLYIVVGTNKVCSEIFCIADIILVSNPKMICLQREPQCADICMYMYTYPYTDTYAYTYTCIYTYIHTHTYIYISQLIFPEVLTIVI